MDEILRRMFLLLLRSRRQVLQILQEHLRREQVGATCVNKFYKYYMDTTVLRIRDVYRGSLIRIFSIPDPWSASNNVSISTQKIGF